MSDTEHQAESSKKSKKSKKEERPALPKDGLPGFLCSQIDLLKELKTLRDILEERIKKESFGEHAQTLSAVLTRSQRVQELSVMVIRGVLDNKIWMPTSEVGREVLSGERLQAGIQTISASLFNDILWEHADVGIIDEDLEKYKTLLDMDIAFLRKHLEYGSYYNTKMEEARMDRQAALDAAQHPPAPPFTSEPGTDETTLAPQSSTNVLP